MFDTQANNAKADFFSLTNTLRVQVNIKDLDKDDQKRIFVDLLQRMLQETNTKLDNSAAKMIDAALKEWK